MRLLVYCVSVNISYCTDMATHNAVPTSCTGRYRCTVPSAENRSCIVISLLPVINSGPLSMAIEFGRGEVLYNGLRVTDGGGTKENHAKYQTANSLVHTVEQKSIGLKFSKSRTGSHVTYSCHHNSSRFTFPIFVHSWRFSVFHSLQSITPHIY